MSRFLFNVLSSICLYKSFSSYFFFRSRSLHPSHEENALIPHQPTSLKNRNRNRNPVQNTTYSTSVPFSSPCKTSLSVTVICESSFTIIFIHIISSFFLSQVSGRLMTNLSEHSVSWKPDLHVNDMVSLDKYLDRWDKETHRNQVVSKLDQQSEASQVEIQPITKQLYRPAIRKGSDSIQQGTHDRFSWKNSFFAKERLSILGITRNQKEKWIEKLKIWISRRILQPLIDAIDHNEIPIEKIPGISSNFSYCAQPTTSNDVRFRVLKTYLSVRDFSCEHIEKRVRQLAIGGTLGSYHFEDTRPYSTGLCPKNISQWIPDAQILMHLFCKYMDFSCYQLDQMSLSDSCCFVRVPDHPVYHKDLEVSIFQPCLYPPHFEVVLSHSGTLEYWCVEHGSQNVFMAIVLFLFYCNRSNTHQGSISNFIWNNQSLLDEIFHSCEYNTS